MGLWDRLAGRLDRDAFAAEVLRRLRRAAAATVEYAYHADTFQLAAGGIVVSLRRVHERYQAAPSRAERRAALDRIVALLAEPPPLARARFDELRHRLRPTVRDLDERGLARLRALADGVPPPPDCHRRLGGHLGVGVAVARAGGREDVPLARLAAWEVPFEEALDAGRRNLAALPPLAAMQQVPGVLRASCLDGDAAARLVLTDELRRRLPVRGDPVVLAPSGPGPLLVAGSDDEAGLLALAHLGEERAAAAAGDPSLPLRLDGDAWVPFAPAPGHAAHVAFVRLTAAAMAGRYRAQGPLLERVVGGDAFVARLVLREEPDGRLVSRAVWSEGVAALLPRADRLVLARAGGDQPVEAPWAAVAALVGERLSPATDLAPERYRVSDFPDEDVLARLVNL